MTFTKEVPEGKNRKTAQTAYTKWGKNALSAFEEAETLAANIQEELNSCGYLEAAEEIAAQLSAVRRKAEKVKTGRLTLLVAGESKCGKSTFINAFLEKELLPMDVKQCTSALIHIRYGAKFSVKATYADGRVEILTEEDKAGAFLRKHAALADEYRGIPVPLVEREILVKSGLRARRKNILLRIHKKEVEALLLLPEVQSANIYNLPDYNDRIRAYIKAKKNDWKDIVMEIEVQFPLVDSVRDIEIIDSPGVCARGGVSEITAEYMQKADAVIFLKPISGQALESTGFNDFVNAIEVERNPLAVFLVLTHAANLTKTDLQRITEEAYKQFSQLEKGHLLFVDSKAELYAQHFAQMKHVREGLRKMNEAGTLDTFAAGAYFDAGGDTRAFVRKLRELARFEQVRQTLGTFGRQSHDFLLESLLADMEALYARLMVEIEKNPILASQGIPDFTALDKEIKNETYKIEKIRYKLRGEATKKSL